MVISALPSLDHAQAILHKAALIATLVGFSASATANVVTDWDSKAVALVGPGAPGEREIAIMHLAIFDAVNSIDRRYRPYLFQLDAAGPTSEDAIAASAAGIVLAALHQDGAGSHQGQPERLSRRVSPMARRRQTASSWAKRWPRSCCRRGRRTAPTHQIPFDRERNPVCMFPRHLYSWSVWPKVVPFVLKSAAQFSRRRQYGSRSRVGIWASDYNEIKAIGNKNSKANALAQQTETARFWLMTGPTAYHPLIRELVLAKQLDVVDSAHAMALYAVALTDAYIAVFDAKYHYEFWRPITAIRNGDIDGNPATAPDATWQPIDNTLMQNSRIPCAHCIESGAAVAILESLRGSGDMPEFLADKPGPRPVSPTAGPTSTASRPKSQMPGSGRAFTIDFRPG